MYQRTSDLLKRKFVSYLVPTILMTMALSLGSIVDSLIVANFLPAAAFSAVGLCQPVSLCFNTVFNFFGVGGATMVAIAKGRKEDERANTIFSSMIVILIAFSVFFMVLGTLFLNPLAQMLGKGNTEVFDYVKEYARAMILGCPAIILVSGIVFFVRTDGKPKIASSIVITSNVVNLVCDYLLVAVIKVGVIGASISTVIGYLVGGLLLLRYHFSKERTLQLVKPKGNLFSLGGSAATAGVSSGLNTGLMFLKNLCVNMIIMGTASLGAIGAASFNVCNQTLTLAALFVGGTIQTILPIIGVLYGEKDKTGIRMTLKTAFQFAFTAAIVLCIVIEIGAGVIAGFFNMQGEAKEIAVKAIRCYCLMLPFYAFNFIMINYYQTTQKKLLAAVLSTFQGFLYVILAVFLLSKTGDGSWLWLGFVIGESLTFATIWVLSYFYGKKYHLQGLFLEQNVNTDNFMEITIHNKIEEAVDVSKKIMDFCKEKGVKKSQANRMAIAAEEMTVNIIRYGYNKDKLNYIDLNVRIVEGNIILRVRDDGVFFNPLTFQAEGMEYSGIETVKKIASDVQYSRVLGFNTVIITL